jgi:hypothetical protein
MATEKEEPKGSIHSLDPIVPGTFPDDIDAALSAQQTLTQTVYARRVEYTRPRRLRVKVGSWNVGNHDCARDVGAWFARGKRSDRASASADSASEPTGRDGAYTKRADERSSQSISPDEHASAASAPEEDEFDMYVLGLQEVVDVSSPAEALRPYADPTTANKYKESVQDCLPAGYIMIAEQQLIGLLILVYVSPDVYEDVKSATTTTVGTGLMGYMGNKGAVATHIILGEATRLVFVNCHLAAGADKAALDRRNWDAAQVTSRTKFDKIEDPSGASHKSEGLGDEDFAFWFGDLNYRLVTMPGDDVRRLLALHTGDELDQKATTDETGTKSDTESESSSTDLTDTWSEAKASGGESSNEDDVPEALDPASLQTTISSLLPHDELALQIKNGFAFYEGWREGPIRFLPTYKYDVGTVGVFDSSDKKRGPSWCDRILYRTRSDYSAYQQRINQEAEARLRDEQLKSRGIEEDENVIFDYDPEDDGDDVFQPAESHLDASSRSGDDAGLELDHYDSHQHVVSSDHKPLSAAFSLTYQAVVPELKSKVHAEVVRELDRKENEGRPTVTVVIDKPAHRDGGTPYHDADRSGDVVSFGPVGFRQRRHVNAIVANTGAVPATFSLIDRPVAGLGEEGPAPPWLAIRFDREPDPRPKKARARDPPRYTLEPGDVCDIEFSVFVDDPETARSLNDGAARLDDVLILRVQDGRDHFLPVQGRWTRSKLDAVVEALKQPLQRAATEPPKPSSVYAGIFAAFRGSES